MSSPLGSASLRHPLIPWLGGVAMAVILVSTYFFMSSFRAIYQSHYPKLASQWANDGPFVVLARFGTETEGEDLGSAARINSSARHFFAYDPFIRENRTARMACLNGVFNMAGGALQYLLRDINATYLLIKFLCCVAWFLLLYAIALRLTESAPEAIFCATFVTGFSYLLTFLFVANLSWEGGLVRSLAHNLWSVVSYGRTEGVLRLPRAGFTYASLYLAALLLIKALENESWGAFAAAGLVGGALAYVHPDVWMSYLGAAGLTAVVLWHRRRRLPTRMLVSLSVSALVSLPFLATNFPPNRELLYRTMFGAESPPHFTPSALIYLAVFAAVLRWKRKPADLVIGAVAGASFFLMHVGYILGYDFDPYRWQYIANIFVFLTAVSFLPRAAASRAGLWLAASGLLAAFAFLQGICYAALHFPFSGLPRDYAQALLWLDRNTPADSEVLSINPEVNSLIPAYTRDTVETAFVAVQYSDYPLLSNYERLLGSLRLLGADAEGFVKEIVSPRARFDRRTIVSEGMARERGQLGLEEWSLRIFMFNTSSLEHVVEVMQAGRGHPAPVAPDYVWFGCLERRYAAPGFGAPGGGWTEVYRNPSVTLYARDRHARL